MPLGHPDVYGKIKLEVKFQQNRFYCATIAYHVGLNANSGGRRTKNGRLNLAESVV